MDTFGPETILVGVDRSQNSIEALVWARALGARLGLGVTAAMVWQHLAWDFPGAGKSDPSADDMDEMVVRDLESIIEEAGLENVQCRALRGPTHQALQQASTRPEVKMLVLGTRGLGPIAGLMLGSVSRKLLFGGTQPLVLVPQLEAHVPLDGVVVGLDGSPISESVAAWSARLCSDLGASATILRCIDPGAELPPGLFDEIMTRSQLELDLEWCGPFRDLGVDHRSIIESGDPRACLIETARVEKAGLIVIGLRGSGQFSGLGGTASYLVRHSTLPVAVIPALPDQ